MTIDPKYLRIYLQDPNQNGILVWTRRMGMRGIPGEIAGHNHIVKGENRWTIQLFYRKYLRSRLVFGLYYGRWPYLGMVLDHIDCNTANDCINNLREVTQKQNMENRHRPFGNMLRETPIIGTLRRI